MKKTLSSSAFFNPRFLIALFLLLTGVLVALAGAGIHSDRPKGSAAQDPALRSGPATLVPIKGPISQNLDLRSLPYVPANEESEERRLTRHPFPLTKSSGKADDPRVAQIARHLMEPPRMPAPLLSFDGMNSTQSGCGCLQPDTDGDVGPNHYIQSVNSSIKIFDKNGTPLNGTNGTTYNSFFSAMGQATPCG